MNKYKNNNGDEKIQQLHDKYKGRGNVVDKCCQKISDKNLIRNDR